MASTNITINGTLLSDMGVSLEPGGYENLLQPAQLKDFVENNDPLKNGTEVITAVNGKSVAVVKERDVSLVFLIVGSDVVDFMAKYTAFVNMLYEGAITMHVPDLGQSYRLIYSNSTKYDNYMLKACRLAVKFREPNPANRQ